MCATRCVVAAALPLLWLLLLLLLVLRLLLFLVLALLPLSLEAADSLRLLAGLLLCVVLNAAVAELADLTVQNMPAQLPLLEDLHVLGLVRSVPRRCCLECLRLKCLLERTVVLLVCRCSPWTLCTSRAARFGWAPRAWHPSA